MTDQGQERVTCRALIPLAKFFRMPLLEVECCLPIRKNAETGEWEHYEQACCVHLADVHLPGGGCSECPPEDYAHDFMEGEFVGQSRAFDADHPAQPPREVRA